METFQAVEGVGTDEGVAVGDILLSGVKFLYALFVSFVGCGVGHHYPSHKVDTDKSTDIYENIEKEPD